MNETSIQALERQQQETRNRALAYHVLHVLRDTLQLRGMTPQTNVDDVFVDFTDDSLKVIAPLIEAVDVLEAIIWASDGCIGHRQCNHSMEPWQRARALLSPKWEADVHRDVRWPSADHGR